jgi:DNA-binding response OmpR family regulator
MGIKVLYVEDELFLAKIVKESLQSRGYEVWLENDGAKVLQLFNKCKPDVCVLDIMLPNKDGFEIAEEIRALDKLVPILFLTAKTQTADVVKGFTIGGNDYIKKPFSMEELIVRLNNALKIHSSGIAKLNGEAVSMGKYQFLPNRQLLCLEKDEKKLSYRETALLNLLYESRDGILERRTILQSLWGNDSFFNSRNLDVYITKLRSYLKDDSKLEIMTIKGIGYRFVIG